jgi:Fe-S-cluster containining protein
VNCAERLPLCKAICCRLSFPLTADEVQDGRLRWDLGRPYFIRHDARGACVHQDSTTGACGVYDHRPGLCRRYTCATDQRIWKDFDKHVLNHEWLDANLGPERPQLIQIRMDRTDPHRRT